MASLRLSFTLVVLFGFLCVGNSNVVSSLFGKSSDDKTETNEKTTVSAASAGKPAAEATTTTTTTPGPATACGGLKGFLHICDKNEPADAPKSVKTRSVAENDSDDDSDSDSDDSDDSDERSVIKSSVTTEKEIVKRQAEDSKASEVPEEPPMVDAAVPQPEEVAEEEKRETEDSDSSEDTEDDRRRRRDCRDRDGDYDKDCRKKREYVPSNVGQTKNADQTTEASQ